MSQPILYPYQRRWIADRSRFKVGTFARQTGKTFTTTLEVVQDALEQGLGGGRSSWVILSRGERQAKEAMEEGVKRHLAALGAAFEVVEEDFKLSDGTTVRGSEVVLPGPVRNRITALPANPDTARGFSRNVFLDEFAFHKDSRAIWRALFPVVSAGFMLRAVSTPNGRGNKHYELMHAPDLAKTWSRHLVDIHQAVADGLPRDVEELRAAIGDPEDWAQEFECQFVAGATAYLTFDLIDAAEDEAAGNPVNYLGGPCWVGMDFGRRKDLSTIWVLEEVADLLVSRELVELHRERFATQMAELDRVMAGYRVVRAALDQTGMGEMPVETAQERHGTSRVEGVLFSATRKLEMAGALKDRMEDRRLRIPRAPKLRQDLHSVRKVTGPTGTPRLVAERTDDGHADRFWGLALAVAAAAQPGEHFGYHSVRELSRRADFMRPRDERDRRRVRGTAGFDRRLRRAM